MKNILEILKTWKFWKELFIMTAGMTIAAAAVYYFLMPSKLVVGSITGLSIVIGKLLNIAGIGIKVSQVIVIINAILLDTDRQGIRRQDGLHGPYPWPAGGFLGKGASH